MSSFPPKLRHWTWHIWVARELSSKFKALNLFMSNFIITYSFSSFQCLNILLETFWQWQDFLSTNESPIFWWCWWDWVKKFFEIPQIRRMSCYSWLRHSFDLFMIMHNKIFSRGDAKCLARSLHWLSSNCIPLYLNIFRNWIFKILLLWLLTSLTSAD